MGRVFRLAVVCAALAASVAPAHSKSLLTRASYAHTNHIVASPIGQNNPTGVTPAMIKSYYGLSQSPTAGAGQTIAVVDAFHHPNAEENLHQFSVKFGLPDCTHADGCFQQVFASGKRPNGDDGWALEISLDIEWAHAIAPAAHILLVEARSNSTLDLLTAEAYATSHANVVSNSWSGGEDPGDDPYFDIPGVTILASSGDTGGEIGWPSTSTKVVSVGGTSIVFDGTHLGAESAWSSGGGGPSNIEPQLPEQAPWYTAGKRGTPDVAMDADPASGYSVFYRAKASVKNAWITVGGTSGSCPAWAGIVAVANQLRGTPLPGSAAPMYQIANLNYAANYKDITVGNNTYPATPRYDLATGLGSPNANTAAALAAL